MFSLLQRFSFSQNSKSNSAPPPPMPVVRRPQSSELAVPISSEANKNFSCLNDVFGELLDDESPLALSKW